MLVDETVSECVRRYGFTFALISDHYHPWIDAQGHSSFVWSVLGGIAQATRSLQVGTGVTCPLMRMHPAIIAQAATTVAVMMPGRFFLGVGTGESLNEHILGAHWPETSIRLHMLEEAMKIIRLLWSGGERSYYGDYYVVENARLYAIPDQPIPLMVAASGPRALELAGRFGDGLISVAPQRALVRRFEESGGSGKPRYGQVTVYYDEDEAAARRIAHRVWPISTLGWQLKTDLARPAQFEETAATATEDQVAEQIVCGPDPQRHVEAVQAFIDAG